MEKMGKREIEKIENNRGNGGNRGNRERMWEIEKMGE